jgi:hypothetical protein
MTLLSAMVDGVLKNHEEKQDRGKDWTGIAAGLLHSP